MMPKKRLEILFLCTGNSCRSQMAEGLARKLKGNFLEVYSAGIEAHGLNPRAVKVMGEIEIDITQQRSKKVEEVLNIPFDFVITVCGHAHETCPIFPGKAKILHVGFEDPPKMALKFEKDEDKINCYRQVRDKIKTFVETLPTSLFKKGEDYE
jgi:arsenate reductase (thioredoxin)